MTHPNIDIRFMLAFMTRKFTLSVRIKGEAPCSNKISITSRFPHDAASISGVMPPHAAVPLSFTTAPCCNNSLTISTWPKLLASCNGNHPLLSLISTGWPWNQQNIFKVILTWKKYLIFKTNIFISTKIYLGKLWILVVITVSKITRQKFSEVRSQFIMRKLNEVSSQFICFSYKIVWFVSLLFLSLSPSHSHIYLECVCVYS